jgi:uncharacterized protein YcnI
LEIISVDVKYSHYGDYYEVNVDLKEVGWISGDEMPDDIYDDYIKRIKVALDRKKEKYIKEYNILQSQKTTQKMKYRSINLYSVSAGYRSKYQDSLGIISVRIDPSI